MMKKLLQVGLTLFATGTLFAQTSIPNGGFEKWNTTTWLDPQYYQSSNAQNAGKGIPANTLRVGSAYAHSYAVQISTIKSGNDTSAGYFIDGNPGGAGIQGGIPYSQKPTGVRFYYKYTHTSVDTGVVLAIFKLGGSPIGFYEIKLDTAKYYKLSATSFTLPATPDTVVFGAVSSLAAINSGRGMPGSVLTIDSVTFTGGVTQPAELNGDFENWQPDSMVVPVGWQFASGSGAILNYQTTDKYTGKYALELQTTDENYQGKDSAVTAEATTGIETGYSIAGGHPFVNQKDTLEVYYKYTPANPNDSAIVSVQLKKNGANVLWHDTLMGASATYKRFRMPFNAASAPDSAIVVFNSSKKWRQAISYVGADLKVDNVRFTSQAVAPVAGFTGGNVVCVGSSINYTDTSQNSPTTYSWTFGGGTPGTSAASTQSVLYSTPGNYTTTLVVSNSAGSDTAMSTVTVVTSPTVVVTGNTSICPGGSTVLTASGGSTYLWSTTSTNDTIQVVTPANTTTYSVTGSAIGGCSGTATVTVTVNPTPTVTATATPTVVCSGNSTKLTAGGATTYSWSTGSTTSSSTITPLASATYTVTGTSLGCMATQTVMVTVNASPTLAISAKTPICSGTRDTLRVIDTAGDASPLTYKWNTGLAKNQLSGKLFSTSTFTMVITDALGCKDSATQKIIVNTNPTVAMAGNVLGGFTICSGNIDSLKANASGGSGIFNYKWSNAGTNDTALVKTAGTYSVLVTDGNGCAYTGSTSVTVKVNPTPTVTLSYPSGGDTICQGGSVKITASGIATTYTWAPSAGFSATTGAVVTANPAITETFTVTGTKGTCSSSKIDTIVVNVCTGVSSVSQSQSVTVYPNPSTGMFTVYLSGVNGEVNMDIYNILGSKVYTLNKTEVSQFSIDMGSQPSGIYLYRLYSTNGAEINKGRLIIAR